MYWKNKFGEATDFFPELEWANRKENFCTLSETSFVDGSRIPKSWFLKKEEEETEETEKEETEEETETEAPKKRGRKSKK